MARPLTTEAKRLMRGLSVIEHAAGNPKIIAEHVGITEQLAALHALRRAADHRPRYVYLMATNDSERVRYFKIGTALRPHIRLTQIQTGTGANMPPAWEGQLVRPLALRLGSFALESTIHQELASYRVPRTEWFKADLDVCQYIVSQDAWYVWDGSPAQPDELID